VSLNHCHISNKLCFLLISSYVLPSLFSTHPVLLLPFNLVNFSCTVTINGLHWYTRVLLTSLSLCTIPMHNGHNFTRSSNYHMLFWQCLSNWERYRNTFKELAKVLKRLKQHGLKMRPSKYFFIQELIQLSTWATRSTQEEFKLLHAWMLFRKYLFLVMPDSFVHFEFTTLV